MYLGLLVPVLVYTKIPFGCLLYQDGRISLEKKIIGTVCLHFKNWNDVMREDCPVANFCHFLFIRNRCNILPPGEGHR